MPVWGSSSGGGFDDYVYLYINTPDPTITGGGNDVINWNGDVYEVGSGDLMWPYDSDDEQVGPLVPGRLYLATASVQVDGQANGDTARINIQTSPSSALLGGNPGNQHTQVAADVEAPRLSVAMLVMVDETAAAKCNVTVEAASGLTVATLRELMFAVMRVA